jgi:O-antigen/teichoic acid export membrane protein
MISTLRASLTDTTSLKARVIRAGGWTFFGYILNQLIRLISNIILTRLLVPEMFGVMSLVSVIMVGVWLFSDFGLLQNVVRSEKGEEKEFLNTVWTVQIIRGFILSLFMLLISYLFYILNSINFFPIGSAYSNQLFPGVIAVLFVNLIISGFNSTSLLVANRKLYLGRVTAIDLASQLFGIIFMIIWALFYQSIWALVFGGIVTTSLKMLFSHFVVYDSRDRLGWDWKSFSEIFHFGKWIFLSSILSFLLNQGDRILLGAFISSATLGIYSIALYLATALKLVFNKVFSAVFFPALSEVVRDNPERLLITYYGIRKHIDILSFSVSGFLFSFGGTLVNILYDERYVEAGKMLQILSLTLISIGPTMLADQCLLALGRARLTSYLNLVQVIILYSLLPTAFYFYGLDGAIWVIALYPFTKMVNSLWYMRKFNILSIRKEIRMVPVFFIGLVLGLLLSHLVPLISRL